MKIKPEYEKELVDKAVNNLEDALVGIQSSCLSLELMNDDRMNELSDITLKLHEKFMIIINELEDYKSKLNASG